MAQVRYLLFPLKHKIGMEVKKGEKRACILQMKISGGRKIEKRGPCILQMEGCTSMRR